MRQRPTNIWGVANIGLNMAGFCALSVPKQPTEAVRISDLTLYGLVVVTTAQRVYLPPVAGVNSALSCGPWSRSTSSLPEGRFVRAAAERSAALRLHLRLRRSCSAGFTFSKALPALVSNATKPSGAFWGEGQGSTVVARLRLAITRSVGFGHLDGCA